MTRASWTHLRSSLMAQDMRKGLEARLADPLWTMARQWQLGEFDGDDAASPVKVRVVHRAVPIGGLSSPLTPDVVHSPDADELIEPMIEAQPAEESPAYTRMSGEAGLQLLRMLPSNQRADTLTSLQDAHPLILPDDAPKLLRYLAQGAFDGAALYDEIAGNAGALAAYVTGATDKIRAIEKQWGAYVANRFAAQTGNGFWRPDRLEHSAQLHTSKGAVADVTLSADAYAGGDLDWHGFDIEKVDDAGSTTELPSDKTEWLLPTPIAYSGMPAERFWDFEDGEVFFGGITTKQTDLAQIILTEFATVYSNDWFMIPVPTHTGTLNRIVSLEVHDTFSGTPLLVEACATKDSGARPWRFFELAGDPSSKAGLAPWLYVPRATSGGDLGRPVEKVMFRRDDAANLAWGIEQVVESAEGSPLDRDQHWKRLRDAFPDYTGEGTSDSANEADEDMWRYRLLTTAPPHWVPFAPEVVDKRVTGRLVRSRMAEWQLLGDARHGLAGPQGQIMDPAAPMVIEEEELLRGGLDVTRRYQSARTPDGRLVLWVSRAKAPAKGEASSGRMTDVIRTGKGS